MAMMRIIRTFLPLLCVLIIGCHGGKRIGDHTPMSENDALYLAVSLANETCMKRFSVAPFDTTTFAITSTDGRWQWGGLDLKGVDGFSALVSFDPFGSDRKVDIYFSSDKPLIERNVDRQPED